MPLNVRSIAVSIAVICFFVLSIIGGICGLSPFTCCKRAFIGAVLVYIAGGWAVRAINAILVDAIITNQVEQHNNSGFGANHGIGFEGKDIVIKKENEFYRIPLTKVELEEDHLRLKGRINWKKAKVQGEKWRKKELDPL